MALFMFMCFYFASSLECGMGSPEVHFMYYPKDAACYIILLAY
jgi:hypothetical protein